MDFKEILKKQGLTDEQISSIENEMKDNKVYTTSLENADARYTKLKGQKVDLEEQIKTANTTIADLKRNNKDNETLQNTIKEHEATIENLKKEAEKKDFNYALDTALKDAKCKNTKAIKALLNLEGIKLNDGKFEGLESQIEALKQSDGYLFETGQPAPPSTGGPGSHPRVKDGGIVTKADILKMSYDKRVEFYNNNPEQFNNIMNE